MQVIIDTCYHVLESCDNDNCYYCLECSEKFPFDTAVTARQGKIRLKDQVYDENIAKS